MGEVDYNLHWGDRNVRLTRYSLVSFVTVTKCLVTLMTRLYLLLDVSSLSCRADAGRCDFFLLTLTLTFTFYFSSNRGLKIHKMGNFSMKI